MKKVFTFIAVFAAVFALAVSASAYSANGTEVPDLDDKLQEFYDDGFVYATMYTEGGSKWLVLSTAPFKMHKGTGYAQASDDLQFVQVMSRGTYWDNVVGYYAVGTRGKGHNLTDKPIYPFYSSYDLYDNEGNLKIVGDNSFFPQVPLAELVLKVSKGELVAVTIPNLVGALKILVPCGVGLLALLVGLSLFGKRSLLFLKK